MSQHSKKAATNKMAEEMSHSNLTSNRPRASQDDDAPNEAQDNNTAEESTTRIATRGVRTFTNKGSHSFNTRVNYFSLMLKKVSDQIGNAFLTPLDNVSSEQGVKMKAHLLQLIDQYDYESEKAIYYLESVKTQEGIQYSMQFRSVREDLRNKVEQFFHAIDEKSVSSGVERGVGLSDKSTGLPPQDNYIS